MSVKTDFIWKAPRSSRLVKPSSILWLLNLPVSASPAAPVASVTIRLTWPPQLSAITTFMITLMSTNLNVPSAQSILTVALLVNLRMPPL